MSAAAAVESPFRRIAADFAESRIALAGLAVFALVLFVAIAAPLVSPQNPYDLATLDIMDSKIPPGGQSADAMTFWLGSDDQGRDMLSAIFYGLRISLGVGILSTLTALALTDGRDLLDDYVEAQVHGVVDLAADVEALVLDPVYTARGFRGLVETLARDPKALGPRVCFIHTGGLFSLFPLRDRLSLLGEAQPKARRADT